MFHKNKKSVLFWLFCLFGPFQRYPKDILLVFKILTSGFKILMGPAALSCFVKKYVLQLPSIYISASTFIP
jgi:hypothetical protein